MSQFKYLLSGLLMMVGIAHCAAEEVLFDYLGLTLSGNLEIAANKSIKTDGVVLIIHDTLAHYRVETIASLQDGLRDLGVNSIAVTLGLGMDKRHGMFNCGLEQDHRHEDAIDEIIAWVQWLKEKGAGSITVAGHGRGANQVALYAINKIDKSVKRVVLISPLMQTPEKAEQQYQERFHRSLRETLAKAEEHVANEEGNQLLDMPGFLICPNAKVTAGAFADYYGDNPKFKTTNLIQSVKVPVLVVTGEMDTNANEIKAAQSEFSGSRGVSFTSVPGADHDFRDLGDDLAKKIKDFLGQKS